MSLIEGQVKVHDERGQVIAVVEVGDRFEIKLRGEWQRVRLESGGYKGRYYITADGERGRLAISMQVQIAEPEQARDEGHERKTGVLPALEAARVAWVGKSVMSRVALVGGQVCGVVREITTGGQVVFVYLPRCNQVPVRVTFPVERLLEVLQWPGEEAVAA